jgi:hypothetical protein
MLRKLFRRGIPGLVLILVLAGAIPAAAAPIEEPWRGIWNWLVSLRGPELDPNGLTGGDRGLEADPNGLSSDGDRGAGADPDGLTSEEDRGAGADPNG